MTPGLHPGVNSRAKCPNSVSSWVAFAYKEARTLKIFGLRKLLDERNIHFVFEVSLWLKGIFALSEVIAGIAAYAGAVAGVELGRT